MTSTGPRAINCTSCGAGQNVMGGGRVKVHVCDYCGAAMDASENFEVLAQFSKAQDLGSPFVPGMTGTIDGIDWVVIGTLERSETWETGYATWYEHQLYSETHGYAWLSVEDGNLVFSRRMRGECRPQFITMSEVERSHSRPSIRVMDHWIAYGELDVALPKRMFRYHESGQHKTERAAGSFTWLPKVGEWDRTVTFVRDTEALHCTESQMGEREITLSRYLPAVETYESFGVAPEDRPFKSIHILEPYNGWGHERFVKRIAGALALASLVLGLFLMVGSSQWLVRSTGPIRVADLPRAVEFVAPGGSQLVEIRLTSYPENGWAGFDIEIEGPEGQALGGYTVGIQRYNGRDSDGRWTEGSSTGRAVLRPLTAGPHKAIISYSGFEPWTAGANPTPPNSVEVDARTKRGTPRWPLIAAVFFGLIYAASRFPEMSHRNSRAALSDWEDDEEDDD